MCTMLGFMLLSAAGTVKSVIDAGKQRKEMKRAAEAEVLRGKEEKRAADLDTRKERRSNYSTRRRATGSPAPVASGFVGPRSFFSGAA